jgi:transcriptional antiterminator RfaH
MIAPGRRWYVVRTHAHAEAKAVLHLRRQGFDVYLPVFRKERRHGRRNEVGRAPLFPRYCFVAFDVAHQPWNAIRSTRGVEHLIGNGDGPIAVRPDTVSSLRAREDHEGCIEMHAKPRFCRGDRVQFQRGVLSVSSALVEGMAGCDRVAVLLNLLGRSVRVVVDARTVAAV